MGVQSDTERDLEVVYVFPDVEVRGAKAKWELRAPHCRECHEDGPLIATFENEYMAEQAAKLLKEAWRICQDEPF